jgi:hypothetical protein
VSELGNVDAVRLARELESAFGQAPPHGYLEGKTQMRDFVMSRHGLSALQAERLVDTLEAQRLVVFMGDPGSPTAREALWRVAPTPRSG